PPRRMDPGFRRGDDEISVVIPPSLRGAKRRSNPAFFLRQKAGLLRFARNDGETYVLIPAARFRPGCAISLSLFLKRAQGKPGADCARSPVCEGSERKHTG